MPLREVAAPPGTRPLDPRIGVVGTAPFDGIEGYLLPPNGQSRRSIDEYIAVGGYQAAQKAWKEMTPEDMAKVLKRIENSPDLGASTRSLYSLEARKHIRARE